MALTDGRFVTGLTPGEYGTADADEARVDSMNAPSLELGEVAALFNEEVIVTPVRNELELVARELEAAVEKSDVLKAILVLYPS